MKIVLFILFFAFSINSFAADGFKVQSTPEGTDVYFQQSTTSSLVKLGKTPLTLTDLELSKILGESKTFVVSLKRDGYQPYRIMMVRTKEVEMNLEIKLAITEEIKTAKKHDNLMSELFDVQRLIRSNNFQGALTRLDTLEKEYKNFSIIPEMKGLAYYMNKDINKALSMFRIAFSKNPENRDAYKMKVYLEKKLGIDTEIN
jgi:tetratricopeptide (TPR) repeat protein